MDPFISLNIPKRQANIIIPILQMKKREEQTGWLACSISHI